MPAPEAIAAELRHLVAAKQAETRAPSIAAAVLRDGELLWADAVGLADADAGEPATPDHQYRIGSITKTFTAVAVMQLVQQGTLGLEDRLDQHLPVPAHGGLTIRRMLAHASGLQRELPGDVWETFVFPKGTDELLATLDQAEQVLAPGERWHYSNLAFILLGETVAALSGTAYEDYVEQRILQPLGMTRSGFAPQAPTAIAYSLAPYEDRVRNEPMMVDRTGGIAAAGQMWSTVGDLAKWASFLHKPDPEVLDPAALDTMTTVQAMADIVRWQLAWGVGLMLVRSGERLYCGHDGGMPGYLANVLVSREDGLGAAVLTNGDTFNPGELSLSLIDKVRDRFPPEVQAWKPDPGAPPDVAGILGRWWSEGTEFVFRWKSGSLEARLAEAPEWALWARFEPLGDGNFRTIFGRERGELLRVVRDEGGTPVKLYWATYPMTREPVEFGAS